MDFRAEVCSFARPSAMFRTLRRLHGHNLENQGLNDISEAFQNFVTRARFFSIGRLRRTWSHSAVEFLKYRRLLPMLTSDGQMVEQNDFLGDLDLEMSTSSLLSTKTAAATTTETTTASVSTPRSGGTRRDSSLRSSKKEDKRVIVTNVSSRVTVNQLKSFFTKFGPVSSCHIPSEDRRHSLYATLPRKSRSSLTAYVTFKNIEDAERAKNAAADELTFYDQVMLISAFPNKKKSVIGIPSERTIIRQTAGGDTSDLSVFGPRSSAICTVADIASLFGTRLPLSALPSKVLTLILSYLPPVDRIRVERVSKSFLESAMEAWTLNDMLLFSSDSSFGRTFSQSNPLRNSHLKAFLNRCGAHLRCLDISGVVHLLDEQAFEIISSLCPNLEEVNLSGLSGHWRAVRTFGEPLVYLRSITYRDMVNVSEKTIWHLFKPIGMNMRRVDLRGCRRFKGRCFRLFGDALEKILLDGCNRLEKQSLEELCIQSPNITELRLSACWTVSDDMLSLISRSLPYLTSFALCGDRFLNLSPTGLMAVSRLNSLCELSLDYNSAVTDDVLEAVAESVSGLRFLSIAYAGSDVTISKEGVKKIANFKKLQTLDVSSLAAVTDSVLSAIVSGCPKLHTIRCRSCTYLGDEGVCSLTLLKNLEHIDLSGCLLVTSKSIQSLLNAFPVLANSRTAKAVTVVIGGTICNAASLRTRNSRMVVDTSDYSAISSNTARGLLSSSSGFLDTKNDSDESLTDDEFDALTTHRSFIIDALHGEEDDSPLETQKLIDEWAEREARDLGLEIK